jgi:uncharacterized protein (TIGR02611 family)
VAHRTDAESGVPASSLAEGRPGRLHRAREWSYRGRARRALWNSGVVLLGGGLMLAGLVMLVLPGPGWAAIILGLVVLASEYAWAHRALQPVRRVADRAAQAAVDPERRRRNLVLAAFAIAIALALLGWYLSAYGATFDGLRWLPVI